MNRSSQLWFLTLCGCLCLNVATSMASAQTADETQALVNTLPSFIRGDAMRLSNQLGSLEQRAQKPLPEDDDQAASHLRMIDSGADRFLGKLDEVRKKAARQDIPADHPAFVSIEQRIANARAAGAGQVVSLDERKADRASVAADIGSRLEAIDAAGNEVEERARADGGLALPAVNPTAAAHIEQLTRKLEAVEALRLEALATVAARTDGYGQDPVAAVERMEKESGASAVAARNAARYLAQTLPQEISDARLSAAQTIETLVASRMDAFDRGRVQDFSFRQQLDELGATLDAAVKLAPDAPRLGQLRRRFQADRIGWEARWLAAIDKRQFEHHPDADTSAAILAGAEAFAERQWGEDGRYEYQDLVVTGPWRVTKKDLLGRPTQYGLPVIVAVEDPRDSGRDVWRYFELTLVTPESAAPKQAPPFEGQHVGDSGYLRPGALN